MPARQAVAGKQRRPATASVSDDIKRDPQKALKFKGFQPVCGSLESENPNRINGPTRENSGGVSGFLFVLLLKNNIDPARFAAQARHSASKRLTPSAM
jgi:hypothetical protein